MKLIKTKAACQAMTLGTIPVLPSPCCFRRGITNAADFKHAGQRSYIYMMQVRADVKYAASGISTHAYKIVITFKSKETSNAFKTDP